MPPRRLGGSPVGTEAGWPLGRAGSCTGCPVAGWPVPLPDIGGGPAPGAARWGELQKPCGASEPVLPAIPFFTGPFQQDGGPIGVGGTRGWVSGLAPGPRRAGHGSEDLSWVTSMFPGSARPPLWNARAPPKEHAHRWKGPHDGQAGSRQRNAEWWFHRFVQGPRHGPCKSREQGVGPECGDPPDAALPRSVPPAAPAWPFCLAVGPGAHDGEFPWHSH